jgi:hypothetical protein
MIGRTPMLAFSRPGVRRGLPWVLCGFALAAAGGSVALDVLDRARIHSLQDVQPTGPVMAVSFSVLGVLIVSRRSGNRIGWIFLLIGVVLPLQSLGILYYERSVLAGGLPGARWAAWLSNWSSLVVFPTGLALFSFLLFPNGRLPSRRWRPFAWIAALQTAAWVVLNVLDPTPIDVGDGFPTIGNPTGVHALGQRIDSAVNALWYPGLVLIAVVIANLVQRGRRASSLERQQVKLLAYAAAVTIACILAVMIVSLAGVTVSNSVWDVLIVFGFGVAVPVACGTAILRHGLYEIDRLISRTISYGLLTGLLVALFAGLVLLTTRVLPFSSPVGVAAATLAAAGLFTPLRRRIQRLVDRRFNRARYDAEATIAAFNARLRDAVDLDVITSQLVHVVNQTVAPKQTTFWLRPPPLGQGGTVKGAE